MIHHAQSIKFGESDCNYLESLNQDTIIENYLADRVDQGDDDKNGDSEPGIVPMNASKSKEEVPRSYNQYFLVDNI
eukprot:14619240-Ditylum_brightwellii.AAC.1